MKEHIHAGEIFSFAFNKDFTLLATCSKDHTCHVMNPETMEIWKTFDKQAPVRTAFFHPLADPTTFEKFHLVLGGGQDPKDVTTTGTKVAGFESRMFSLITGQELAKIKGHFGPVHSIQISPCGKVMVSVGEDGTIRCQRFPQEYLGDPMFK